MNSDRPDQNMGDADRPWRRSIEANRALDPTYAKPPPWFVGNGKGVMIAVISTVIVLVGLRILTTAYLAEEWYRWWRAPIPTVLPKTVSAATFPVSAIGNQGEWFPPDSYPDRARQAGEQGRVLVALLIGVDGRPSACEVLQSSRSARLDEITCRLAVRNGRFNPARDRHGDAVEARFVMRNVVWLLDK